MESTESDLPKCGMFESRWLAFGGATRAFGKDHAEISVVCQIQAEEEVTADRLAHAWEGLGIEYPNLRAIPVDFRKRHVDVEEWVQKTFTVEADLAAPALMPKVPPRDLPGLWWLPSSSEVLFVSQHWRVDGIGALMLVGRLMEILAQGKDARIQPPDNPSLVIEDAAHADSLENSALQAWGVGKAATFFEVMFMEGNTHFEGDQLTLPGCIG